MGKITAIRSSNGREKRVKIFLDSKLAFNLGAEMAAKEDLQVGQEIPAERVEALAKSDCLNRCLEAALRYLSYRPRSESEIRGRLHQRGFDDNNIEAVIAKLKQRSLIDDTAFTQFWKENREMFSPRSKRLTRLELRRKGVDSDIIDEVVGTIDEGDSAYRAALSKAHSLPLIDYQIFRRRLGGYLRRRGFGYETINHTVRQIWQELGGRFGDSVSP